MEMTLLHADDGIAIASLGPVFLSVLRKPLTMAGIARLRELSRHMQRLHGAEYGSLAVLEPGTATDVTADVRDASAKFANEFSILGAAITIEGSGFRPAATRTLIATVYLLNKPKYPYKICGTVAEGAGWLVQKFPTLAAADEIIKAAEASRSAIK
jgi:hypothetical protein